MRAPRWLHRSWALWAGYFWSPCPECGQMFGGHERQPQIPFTVYGEGSLMLCPRCAPIVSAREFEAFKARWRAQQEADRG